MVGEKIAILSSMCLIFTPLLEIAVAQGTVELVIISENITIDAGESALLVCVGFSLYNDTVEIIWQRNGQTLTNTSTSFLSSEDLVHRGRLFTQSFLQLCDMQYADSGNYTCIVRNGTDSVNSMVEVTVENVIELALITNHTTVDVGENALLVCVGYGQPDVNITWSKAGETITNTSGMYITEEDIEIGGRVFKQSFLRICALQTCHTGAYNCSVNNGISTVKSHTYISVEGEYLNIASISNMSAVSSGDPLQLICMVQPAENTDITWSHNGHIISNSGHVNITQDYHVTSSGERYKRSVLNYMKTQDQDGGQHWCNVTSYCGYQTRSVDISVSPQIETPAPSSSIPIIYIIVAVVVVVTIIIIAIIVVLCVLVRKKKAISKELVKMEPDNTYEEIGKGTDLYKGYEYVKPPRSDEVAYEKPNNYDMEFLQKNSAYGVVQAQEPLYMDADTM